MESWELKASVEAILIGRRVKPQWFIWVRPVSISILSDFCPTSSKRDRARIHRSVLPASARSLLKRGHLTNEAFEGGAVNL